MKVVRQLSGLALKDRGAVVAIGNFDGVHLGHRAVIEAARREASALGVALGAIVFEPHPQEFFRPEAEDFRLTPLPVKARLLEALGVDIVYALPFDTEMAARLAPEFVLDVLIEGLGVLHAVIGSDFRFGRGRSGDAAVLGYMGEAEGIGVTIVPPEAADDGVYSSSRIRDLLRHGKPEVAARFLGRPWAIQGRVRAGDKLGRELGFPTINLGLDGYLKPAHGVYAVKVEALSGAHKGKRFDAAAYVGRRPTFGKTEVLLEATLFDFKGDLYDAEVAVELHRFLRYDQKFENAEALKAQMAKDCEAARGLLSPETAPRLKRP
jgi:riboflavin kinase/FMN adenylyltransferase